MVKWWNKTISPTNRTEENVPDDFSKNSNPQNKNKWKNRNKWDESTTEKKNQSTHHSRLNKHVHIRLAFIGNSECKRYISTEALWFSTACAEHEQCMAFVDKIECTLLSNNSLAVTLANALSWSFSSFVFVWCRFSNEMRNLTNVVVPKLCDTSELIICANAYASTKLSISIFWRS